MRRFLATPKLQKSTKHNLFQINSLRSVHMSRSDDNNRKNDRPKSNSGNFNKGKGNFKSNSVPRKFTKGKTDDDSDKLYKPSRAKEEIRLNRYVANAGVCSRREADVLIAKGLVMVNGEVVTEMGHKVLRKDVVRYNDKILNPENLVYILLNKPKDFATTIEGENVEKRAIDLVRKACPERLYPVGRLDRATSGVLLFTNDGELSEQLTNPANKVAKIYHVTTDKPVSKNHMVDMLEGIKLEDGVVTVDKVEYANLETKTELGIVIDSVKNRVVHRMLEKLGYDVKKLDRVYFAGLTKKNISRSKWRFLSEREINSLKMKRFQ